MGQKCSEDGPEGLKVYPSLNVLRGFAPSTDDGTVAQFSVNRRLQKLARLPTPTPRSKIVEAVSGTGAGVSSNLADIRRLPHS